MTRHLPALLLQGACAGSALSRERICVAARTWGAARLPCGLPCGRPCDSGASRA